MAVPVRFVGQEKHGEVYWRVQHFARPRYAVEPVAVAPAEVHWHYVAVGCHAFHDECLGPRQVAYHSFVAARAQPCGEHHDIVVSGKAFVYHLWRTAALCACLVHRYAERLQPGQVREYVVEYVFYLSAVAFAYFPAYGYAVGTSERVVAGKCVAQSVAVGREVLLSFDGYLHVEVFYCFF